jgi:two-component system, OmpR family, phosphate regulon sensor histidine kinase PhoR
VSLLRCLGLEGQVSELLEFLLGLSIGLLCLFIYKFRLLKKLQHTHRSTSIETLSLTLNSPSNPVSNPELEVSSSLSLTSQMFRTLNHYQARSLHLEAELEDWENIINLAPIGYLRVDDENQLVRGNPPALELLNIQGYNANEPRLLLELVRSYDLDALIDQARSTGKACQSEWTLYPASINVAHVANPTPYPLRGYAMPMRNGQVGVLLESRAEAQRLSQQRDRWTSDVAHELKTPLTSIRLVTEMLQPRLEPPLRTWVDRLLKEIIRLSTLVQEILDLSQLEAARTRPLKLNSVDLPDLVNSAWLSLEPIATAKSIQLSYQGPEHLVIQGDDARLHRVLINLLDNSIKYTLPERPILLQLSLVQDDSQMSHSQTSHVSRSQSATIVQLDLIDGGTGFPEEDLPMVFERFYRADFSRSRLSDMPLARTPQETVAIIESRAADSASGTVSTASGSGEQKGEYQKGEYKDENLDGPFGSRRPQVQPFQPSSGSGLGLAIVRQIVDLHQGTIVAKNHPEGGAWIQIRLPQRQTI